MLVTGDVVRGVGDVDLLDIGFFVVAVVVHLGVVVVGGLSVLGVVVVGGLSILGVVVVVGLSILGVVGGLRDGVKIFCVVVFMSGLTSPQAFCAVPSSRYFWTHWTRVRTRAGLCVPLLKSKTQDPLPPRGNIFTQQALFVTYRK